MPQPTPAGSSTCSRLRQTQRAQKGLLLRRSATLGKRSRNMEQPSKTLRSSPVTRSNAPMSTRDTSATTQKHPRRVFISGQKRGVFGVIKRELRRRSAIEPVIGHLKSEGYLGRCYLKGRAGDAANVVLSAVGHNFRRILAWLREFLCLFLVALSRSIACSAPVNSA